MNIKEIAINYYYDKDYYNTLEEYIDINNIDIDIKKLKFRIKIEENKRSRIKKVKELKDLFTSNTAVQFSNNSNNTKKAIFHKCTKSNGNIYQISFIDSLGAEMDIAADTIDNIINDFLSFYTRYNIIDEVIIW